MNQKVEFSSIAVHLTRPSSDSSIGLTVWSEGDHEAQSHDSASIFKRLKEHGVCAVLPPTSDLKEIESRTEALRRLIFDRGEASGGEGDSPSEAPLSVSALADHYIHKKEHRQHLLLDHEASSSVTGFLTRDILDMKCYSSCLHPDAPVSTPNSLRLVEAAAIRTSFRAANHCAPGC